MRLELMTWLEVEAHLLTSDGILLPTGSYEQHGPIGLIGTDALCAQDIATGAAERAKSIVAPVLGYTPASFNMDFPGTLSVSEETYGQLVGEVVEGLIHHGFRHIYILNGHGANLAPIHKVLAGKMEIVRVKSWWDFDAVNILRTKWYGDWEACMPRRLRLPSRKHAIASLNNRALSRRKNCRQTSYAHTLVTNMALPRSTVPAFLTVGWDHTLHSQPHSRARRCSKPPVRQLLMILCAFLMGSESVVIH